MGRRRKRVGGGGELLGKSWKNGGGGGNMKEQPFTFRNEPLGAERVMVLGNVNERDDFTWKTNFLILA